MGESTRAGRRWGGKLLLLVALATLSTVAPAQELDDSAEFETWTDLATIHSFNENFRYDGDYGIRSLLTTRGFWQLYLRPSVRYVAKPWLMLHGGVAWFHTNIEDTDNANEIRPWGGIRFLAKSSGDWTFSNYFRLEYRAFKLGDRKWDYVWRPRFQFQVTTPRFDIGKTNGWYVLSFVEGFSNFGTDIDEVLLTQFRFDLGLGKQISRGLRIEPNYLYQKMRVEGLGLTPTDHILRIRLYYRFD